MYGPESSEIKLALGEVDGAIRLLMGELKKRNISDCVNIVITSDHGMASYNSSMFINLYKVRYRSNSFFVGALEKFPVESNSLLKQLYMLFTNVQMLLALIPTRFIRELADH